MSSFVAFLSSPMSSFVAKSARSPPSRQLVRDGLGKRLGYPFGLRGAEIGLVAKVLGKFQCIEGDGGHGFGSRIQAHYTPNGLGARGRWAEKAIMSRGRTS